MSNYNSIIEQNNTELEEILESVEALPDAENLDDVMDEQDSLIDQIQAALEGKAGGTSLNTCTVAITATSFQIDFVSYMSVDENNEPIYACITENIASGTTKTISCLCNSTVTIYHSRHDAFETVEGCTLLYEDSQFVSVGLGSTDATIEIGYRSGGND